MVLRIIKSINKSSYKNVYSFDKDVGLAESFYNLFLDLGIPGDSSEMDYFMITEEHYMENSGKRFIDVRKITDRYFAIPHEDYDVDIFVGSQKVFLIIRTKKDEQQRISDLIFKYFDMSEGKK